MKESLINVIVTAGGTSEPIDNVRRIANTGTGRLGSLIAEELAADAMVGHIFYVCAKDSFRPVSEKVVCVEIESVSDLQAAVTELMEKNEIHGIIHSMAVSDFTPAFSFSEEQLAKKLPASSTQEELANWFAENEQIKNSASKISSDTEHLVLVLKKTPKIISYLREWQPKAKIIGFKLLVDVPKESLLTVAKNSLTNNKTDFIFANDLTEIHGETHHGYLLSKDGTVEEAQSKSEIAALITEKIRLEESK